MWLAGGRLVSATLADKVVRKKLQADAARRRKNPEALKRHYVKMGVLTPDGKLTKRYGG
jgi:hypothetical protein